MPDIVSTALALPGLVGLALAVCAAGLVRGFTGFGSAMIIMPMASSVLDPFAALAFLAVVEFWGPLPNLPAALREGEQAGALRLLGGAAVGLPLGLWVLSMLNPDIFGWCVSGAVLVLLAFLIMGWRYGGTIGPRTMISVGGLGGMSGGIAGLPGPPVIMLYMASEQAVSVIRANFLLYLMGVDVMMLGIFAVSGLLDAQALVVGGLLAPLYMAASVIGARLFNPDATQLFRLVAYIVIAASAILGLPIWN